MSSAPANTNGYKITIVAMLVVIIALIGVIAQMQLGGSQAAPKQEQTTPAGNATTEPPATVETGEPTAEQAELKRFFLRPAYRGQGLGRRLVQAIEAEARRRGCPRLMLETGVLQPDAIALYRGQGFGERGPFGSYTDDPLSVFMEKALSAG